MRIGRLLKNTVLTAAFAIAADIGIRVLMDKTRPLSADELKMVQPVFGNTIDYSKVRVSGQPVSSLVLIFDHDVRMSIHNTLYCAGGKNSLDELLVHEMMHIYQYQHHLKNTGINGAMALWFQHPLNYDNHAYIYRADTSLKLSDYNMEQQADIVMNYYAKVKDMESDIEGIRQNTTHFQPVGIVDGAPAEERALRKIINADIPQPDDSTLLAQYASTLKTRQETIDKNNAQLKDRQIPEKIRAICAAFGSAAQSGDVAEYKYDHKTDIILTDKREPDLMKSRGIEATQIMAHGRVVYHKSDAGIDFYAPGDWEKKLDALYQHASTKQPPAKAKTFPFGVRYARL